MRTSSLIIMEEIGLSACPVVDPEGVHSNPLLAPVFKYIMKMK